LADQTVIGYYSLAVGSVEFEQAPGRVTKGLAHHPIRVMLLARLAVDHQWQKKWVGAGLLKDAMLRTLQAADIVGIRAPLVLPKIIMQNCSTSALTSSLHLPIRYIF
jgi:GNAT superfamily N-acetyltransferase